MEEIALLKAVAYRRAQTLWQMYTDEYSEKGFSIKWKAAITSAFQEIRQMNNNSIHRFFIMAMKQQFTTFLIRLNTLENVIANWQFILSIINRSMGPEVEEIIEYSLCACLAYYLVRVPSLSGEQITSLKGIIDSTGITSDTLNILVGRIATSNGYLHLSNDQLKVFEALSLRNIAPMNDIHANFSTLYTKLSGRSFDRDICDNSLFKELFAGRRGMPAQPWDRLIDMNLAQKGTDILVPCNANFEYTFSFSEEETRNVFQIPERPRRPESVSYAPLPQNEDCHVAFNYLDVCDGLDPLEAHLLRLFSYYYDRKAGNSTVEPVLAAIGEMLWPGATMEMSGPVVKLFVHGVFHEIMNYGRCMLGAADAMSVDDKMRMFKEFLGNAIPSVFHNMTKLMETTQPNPEEFVARYNANYGGDSPIIEPLSWKRQLIPFLICPKLREECPVIYTYLRLFSRFQLVKDIPKVINKNTNVWDSLLENVCNGPLTSSARENLSSDTHLSEFTSMSAVFVLEAITHPHNEFVQTLKEHCGIKYKEVPDVSVTAADEIDLLTQLVVSARSFIQDNGMFRFCAALETSFSNSVSRDVYPLIICESLRGNACVVKGCVPEHVMVKFEKKFVPKAITLDQKRILRNKIQKENLGTSMVSILESMMSVCISFESNWMEFMHHALDVFADTFMKSMNCAKEIRALFSDFTVSQLSQMVRFLTTTEYCAKPTACDIIVERFKQDILPKPIDNLNPAEIDPVAYVSLFFKVLASIKTRNKDALAAKDFAELVRMNKMLLAPSEDELIQKIYALTQSGNHPLVFVQLLWLYDYVRDM